MLPTVLYLLVGVLCELVRGGGGPDGGPLVSGALQALRSVLSTPLSRVEKSREAWSHLLRCALQTLLDCGDTGTYTGDAHTRIRSGDTGDARTHTHTLTRTHAHTHIDTH